MSKLIKSVENQLNSLLPLVTSYLKTNFGHVYEFTDPSYIPSNNHLLDKIWLFSLVFRSLIRLKVFIHKYHEVQSFLFLEKWISKGDCPYHLIPTNIQNFTCSGGAYFAVGTLNELLKSIPLYFGSASSDSGVNSTSSRTSISPSNINVLLDLKFPFRKIVQNLVVLSRLIPVFEIAMQNPDIELSEIRPSNTRNFMDPYCLFSPSEIRLLYSSTLDTSIFTQDFVENLQPHQRTLDKTPPIEGDVIMFLNSIIHSNSSKLNSQSSSTTFSPNNDHNSRLVSFLEILADQILFLFPSRIEFSAEPFSPVYPQRFSNPQAWTMYPVSSKFWYSSTNNVYLERLCTFLDNALGVVFASWTDSHPGQGFMLKLARTANDVFSTSTQMIMTNPLHYQDKLYQFKHNPKIQPAQFWTSLADSQILQYAAKLLLSPKTHVEFYLPRIVGRLDSNGNFIPKVSNPLSPLTITLLAKDHLNKHLKTAFDHLSSSKNPSFFDVPAAESKDVIFHLHGGGFISGNAFSAIRFLTKWAYAMPSALFFSLDYSKAPDFPWPCAVLEGLHFYGWMMGTTFKHTPSGIIKHIPNPLAPPDEQYVLFPVSCPFHATNISLIGDSAGGALCSNITNFSLITPKLRKPTSLFLFYPATNLHADWVAPSRIIHRQDPVIPSGLLLLCVDSYLGGIGDHAKKLETKTVGIDDNPTSTVSETVPLDGSEGSGDPTDLFHQWSKLSVDNPLASPLCTPLDILTKYPETHIFTGDLDPLLDDACSFAYKIAYAFSLAKHQEPVTTPGSLSNSHKSSNKVPVDIDIPLFLFDCVDIISSPFNIQTQGIFRTSGKVKDLDPLLDRLSHNMSVDLSLLPIGTVTSLFKRAVSECAIFDIDTILLLERDALYSLDDEPSIPIMRDIILSRLSPNRIILFSLVFSLLSKVVKHSHTNLMPAPNLAKIFVPCVFSEYNPMDLFSHLVNLTRITKVCISHFDDFQFPQPSKPPKVISEHDLGMDINHTNTKHSFISPSPSSSSRVVDIHQPNVHLHYLPNTPHAFLGFAPILDLHKFISATIPELIAKSLGISSKVKG